MHLNSMGGPGGATNPVRFGNVVIKAGKGPLEPSMRDFDGIIAALGAQPDVAAVHCIVGAGSQDPQAEILTYDPADQATLVARLAELPEMAGFEVAENDDYSRWDPLFRLPGMVSGWIAAHMGKPN